MCVLLFGKTELVFQFIFVIILLYFIKVLVATGWKLKENKLVLCCRELEKCTASTPKIPYCCSGFVSMLGEYPTLGISVVLGVCPLLGLFTLRILQTFSCDFVVIAWDYIFDQKMKSNWSYRERLVVFEPSENVISCFPKYFPFL